MALSIKYKIEESGIVIDSAYIKIKSVKMDGEYLDVEFNIYASAEASNNNLEPVIKTQSFKFPCKDKNIDIYPYAYECLKNTVEYNEAIDC